MDRRTFLKLTGIGSLSVATGCYKEPQDNFFSLIHAPDDMVVGKATWYASTCRECPAGCGVIAKNREARVIKVEGNPLHPINKGKLCMRGQSAVQAVFHPDRLTTPLLKQDGEWRPISFAEAEAMLKARLDDAGKKRNKVRMLTETVGDTTLRVMNDLMAAMRSPAAMIFEPFGYESLKTANEMTFGLEGLCSYHIDNADFLLSLGADFVETWLSPVEYARKFKEMHALNHGHKSLFFHVGPYQSVTGANADTWLPCKPGAEAAVALGCIREALNAGKAGDLNRNIRENIHELAAPYTPEKVAELSGVEPEAYKACVSAMLKASTPLVLGQGMGGSAEGALFANLAANLLNIVLDPNLTRLDFENRHRVEMAARRSAVYDLFEQVNRKDVPLLMLNNVNPVFSLPEKSGVRKALENDDLFVVSFSNFMDATAAMSDLIFPVRMPLERWGEYAGKHNVSSTLQPAMGPMTEAPDLNDLLLRLTDPDKRVADTAQGAAYQIFAESKRIKEKRDWPRTIQQGGVFSSETAEAKPFDWKFSNDAVKLLRDLPKSLADSDKITFIAAPSIRFFDGRGANRPWLAEYPDPLTKVAWQSPVLMHPDTLKELGLRQSQRVRVESENGEIEAPAYAFYMMRPGIAVMSVGQGHDGYTRYANKTGANPLALLSEACAKRTDGPSFAVAEVDIDRAGGKVDLAHTDGSKIQHGRKIALSVALHDLKHAEGGHHDAGHGFGMHEFPFTMPLPEGYEPHRDVYPPHEHQNDYRWGMVVDLDKCVGCGACAVACYAENNLGVVGEERIIEGREMSWLRIERYHDPDRMEKVTFFPMLCQHCDNAPCESVCPVYAPHHGKEGMNNQIYNRCIGTRYCSQNCPYKVRRFNWFTWQWPKPLDLQLNPDVTVRSKGVMEKCSFCVQRVKQAHNDAKDDGGRRIRDGEIQPACAQTCPTGVFTFGNMNDPESKVRKLIEANRDRAYQAMGYLNTKPAVIYLKKVVNRSV